MLERSKKLGGAFLGVLRFNRKVCAFVFVCGRLKDSVLSNLQESPVLHCALIWKKTKHRRRY